MTSREIEKAEKLIELKKKSKEGKISEEEKKELERLEKPIKKLENVKIKDKAILKSSPKRVAKIRMLSKDINNSRKKKELKKKMEGYLKTIGETELIKKRFKEREKKKKQEREKRKKQVGKPVSLTAESLTKKKETKGKKRRKR